MSDMLRYGLKMVEEDEASDELKELYENSKRIFHQPFVDNITKANAMSPAALKLYLDLSDALFKHLTIPMSLISIICFTVAEKSDCIYCSTVFEVTCHTLGVDEATLQQIADDMGNLTPERVRVIIEFALKAAKDPQEITPEDYDLVRAQGIDNDEIVQIIHVAGIAVYFDILADSMKIDVDPEFADASKIKRLSE